MPFSRPARVIAGVLARLGIDPSERMIEGEQDPEYTSCRAEEIPRYFELYASGTLTPEEREVLRCFLLQGLNDSIQSGVFRLGLCGPSDKRTSRIAFGGTRPDRGAELGVSTGRDDDLRES